MEKLKLKTFYIIDESGSRDFWTEIHASTSWKALTTAKEIYLDQPNMKVVPSIDKTKFPGGKQHEITIKPDY